MARMYRSTRSFTGTTLDLPKRTNQVCLTFHKLEFSHDCLGYRGPKQQYQCDAIGSVSSLAHSFWRRMHTFRLEWQPGPDGYVHWYIDGQFKFGIENEGLKKENSSIPNEPSYVILNTAISTTWGFPDAPKDCDIYDCKVDNGRCGFSQGFCDMLPAYYLIDHVRVYQNKDDPQMTVGCNPKV